MRPASAAVSRNGKVTSMVSDASRASSAADFRMSRRAASACVTLSLARLILAPSLLRSSGDILPSVASRAEIEPFFPSAATRTASSAASSDAAAIWPRISDSSCDRSVMERSRGARMSSRLSHFVMPGPVPATHVFSRTRKQDVDGRDKPGHDGLVKTRYGGAKAYLRRQRGLGLFGDRLECCRLVDGEIGEHLAVDGDAGLRQA